MATGEKGIAFGGNVTALRNFKISQNSSYFGTVEDGMSDARPIPFVKIIV